MPIAYSADLRERAVALVKRGKSSCCCKVAAHRGYDSLSIGRKKQKRDNFNTQERLA